MDISHSSHFEHDTGYQTGPGASSTCLQDPLQYQAQLQHLHHGVHQGNPGTGSQFYHPHLYSQTALEYGITTSNSPVPAETYYDTTPAYPCNSSVSPVQDHHVINTDNGLSYTNLDYIYSQSGAHPYTDDRHHPHRIPNQPYTDAISIQIHPNHQQCSTFPTSNLNWMSPQHQLHHHPGYVDTGGPLQPPQNSTGNDVKTMVGMGLGSDKGSACAKKSMSHQVYGSSCADFNKDQTGSGNSGQSGSQTSATSTASAVPTYKWMQVKRNVPKPQSKY